MPFAKHVSRRAITNVTSERSRGSTSSRCGRPRDLRSRTDSEKTYSREISTRRTKKKKTRLRPGKYRVACGSLSLYFSLTLSCLPRDPGVKRRLVSLSRSVSASLSRSRDLCHSASGYVSASSLVCPPSSAQETIHYGDRSAYLVTVRSARGGTESRKAGRPKRRTDLGTAFVYPGYEYLRRRRRGDVVTEARTRRRSVNANVDSPRFVSSIGSVLCVP